MSKTIDYLFEDPPIHNQKFALVSIVGPHMPQKCNVWGLKIRGVTDNLEKAKAMTQKLMKIDNNYDIYTVEVGKFFPLTVEPHEVGEVEYENTQLNDLVKSYLENRELANEQWHSRKNEMIKEAVREGKAQEELANKQEHPIAVLQRMKNLESNIKDAQEKLESYVKDLELSKTKFELYTDEEKEIANKELESAIRNEIKPASTEAADHEEVSVDDVRKQLMGELQVTDTNTNNHTNNTIEKTVSEIHLYENELEELQSLKSSIDASTSPNVFSRIEKQITDVNTKLSELKATLKDSKAVNTFINSNYSSSEYNTVFDS